MASKVWGDSQEHLHLMGLVGSEQLNLLLNPYPVYLLFSREITVQRHGHVEISKSDFLLVPASCSMIHSEYLRGEWDGLSTANKEKKAKRHREIGEWLINTDLDMEDPKASGYFVSEY